MAGSGTNKREVRLDVTAGAVGGADVRALAKDIRQLGQDGALAGEEFVQLSTQLENVAQAVDAAAAVQKLEVELAQATAAADKSKTALTGLSETYATVTAKVEQQRAALQASREAEAALVAGRNEQQRQLATLSAETDRADKSTQGYVLAVRQLRLDIIEANRQIEAQKTTTTALKASLSEATAEENKLGAAFRASSAEAERNAKAEQERTVALQASQRAAGALGVATDDLLSSQAALEQQARAAAAQANAMVRAQEAEAAAVKESAEIQRQFAIAVKAADAALAEQVSTLKQVEAAQEAFNRAETEAISAANQDLAANERRIAAANDLIAADARLSVAQRELAAERTANRAAILAEATAYSQAALAARESLAATQAVVAASQSAGRVINDSFGVLGVRSFQQIEAEIKQTELALGLLERKFVAGSVSAKELSIATGAAQVKLAALKTEMNTVPAVAGKFEQLNNAILGMINRFGALSAAVATVGFAVGPIVEVQVELQRLTRVLDTVTGSATTTAAEIKFLREVADQSGQSFTDMSGSFSKFAAAAVSAGVPLATVNEVFRSAALAAGNLGLRTEETNRILTALGQIASKGTVQMEELKGQLGDALPGAVALTAKALNLTTAELTKLIESGGLLATDALPAIGKAMEQLASKSGQIDGLTASWNKFKNAVTESTSAEGSALTTGLEAVLNLGTKIINQRRDSEAELLKYAAAQNARSDADLNWLQLQGRRFGAAVSGWLGLNQTIAEATPVVAAMSQAQIDAQVAQEKLNASLLASVSAQDAAGLASVALTKAQASAAQATAAANLSAAETSSQWARVVLDYSQAVTAAQLVVSVQDKLTTAVKSETDAMLKRAELAGNEQNLSRARADAALTTAAALGLENDAQVRLLTVLREKRDAEAALSAAEGNTNASRLKSIADLNVLIATQEANVQKTKQAADASLADAQAKRLQSAALADNSGKLVEFQAALDAARNNLLKMTAAFAEGKVTQDQYAVAANQVSYAEGLVKDALNDSAAALSRNITALKAKADITLAGLDVQRAQLQAEIGVAESQGNSYLALQKNIELKQLEIKIIESNIAAKLAEVQATRLQIQADTEAAVAAGTLTSAKQAEINARLAHLQVLELEAQAQKAGISVLQAQIDNLRIYGTESVRAYGASSSAIDKETTSLLRNADAASKAAAAKGAAYNAQNMALNTEGNVVNAGGNTLASIISTLTGMGLTAAQAQTIAKDFIDSKGSVPYFNNPGQAKYGGSTLSDALSRAATQFQLNQGAGSAQQTKPSGATSGTTTTAASTGTTTAAASAGSTTHTVNITGAVTGSFNTASAADSAAAVAVLKALGQASTTSS